MAREKKTPHPFDPHLGAAIRAARARRGVSREKLSAQTGIPLSNLKRREDGTNETTVSELERIAAVLRVPAREMVDMALADYSASGSATSGLQKLVSSMSEARSNVIDADNVTYIGHIAPGLNAAAYQDDRATTD